MTAAHAASQERPQPHMKQSANGCVTCPRKWSDHTESERAWAQERPYDDGERILPSEGMDRAVQPEAPATEAGRYLVMWDESDAEPLDLFGYQTVREAVLAVEAEMSDVIEAHAASQERPQPPFRTDSDLLDAYQDCIEREEAREAKPDLWDDIYGEDGTAAQERPHPECIEAYHGQLIATGRTIVSRARLQADNERIERAQKRPQPYEGSFDSETGDGYAPDQERPQPYDPNAMTPIEELDDMREWTQERPSIDMERLRLIVFGVTGYAFNDYAWDQIAAEYERLGDRT
jgi:hypothetical protein